MRGVETMIDIFNKKKVKELQQKLNDLENLLEHKEKANTIMTEQLVSKERTIDTLLSENDKLINWIEKILDEVGIEQELGYNDHIKIPYTQSKCGISKCDYLESYGFSPMEEKRIEIPSITFIKRSYR